MDIVPNLMKLPEYVFVRDATDPRYLNIVKRGILGYFPVTLSPASMERLSAEHMNASLRPVPTARQIVATLHGSMFGWEAPLAQLDFWSEEEAQRLLDDRKRAAEELVARYGWPAPRKTEG